MVLRKPNGMSARVFPRSLSCALLSSAVLYSMMLYSAMLCAIAVPREMLITPSFCRVEFRQVPPAVVPLPVLYKRGCLLNMCRKRFLLPLYLSLSLPEPAPVYLPAAAVAELPI